MPRGRKASAGQEHRAAAAGKRSLLRRHKVLAPSGVSELDPLIHAHGFALLSNVVEKDAAQVSFSEVRDDYHDELSLILGPLGDLRFSRAKKATEVLGLTLCLVEWTCP